MERLPQILICDDDSTFHLAVKYSLKGKYECRSAYNTDEALAIVKNHPVDVILLDVQLRTPEEGLKSIPQLRDTDPDMAIVMSSGRTDFNTVREAMRLGATDYVPKDFDPQDLQLTLTRVLERRNLIKRQQQHSFEAKCNQRQHVLVGESSAITGMRRMVEKMRQSPANVIITGETGTGKEVVARQLRKTLADGTLEPFVAVDSATIQSSTAESQLFGHEKGAFTGAEKATKGIFEEANGGIVYFDEIGNMPLDIQAKLLRVLQEKEVARLGSAKAMKLEFRVVCATNKNLEEMIKAGQFKDDLYQRLNVLPIHIAPLRERKEDIPLLVGHFASKHATAEGKLRFTEESIEVLKSYSWPGNIRELGNLIAYLVAMTDGTEIDVCDLPPRIRDAANQISPVLSVGEKDSSKFYERIAHFESEILKKEYARHEGNVSRLALSLGMDRSHLYTKLKQYRIHSPKTTA